MKSTFKKIGLLVAFMVLSGTMLMAGGADKMLLKAKTEIQNANANDWYTRANWAKRCIAKGAANNDVLKWIEASLQIQENAYTLEVKGDYYAKNNMKDEAIKYYIKSIATTQTGKATYDPVFVQEKIRKLKGR